MSGVAPKIVCPQCDAELKWDAASCPSCGVEIDWTSASLGSPGKVGRRAEERREKKTGMWPSKIILGAIAAAAAAVIAYEAVNGSGTKSGADGSLSAGEMRASDAQAAKKIQALEKAVTDHPDDMATTLQLANSLQDRAMYEKAIQYYSLYLAKNPKDADARVDMGICYKGINDLSEAEKQMKKALSYAPQHLNATFNLGIVCLDERKFQESGEWFEKTVALDPDGEVGKKARQLLALHNSQFSPTQ
jgi:tetratricopeptide (TPR) repeat protein